MIRRGMKASDDLPPGCVQANTTSGVSFIIDELMREEVAFLSSVITALRAVGDSPQCPLLNLGECRAAGNLVCMYLAVVFAVHKSGRQTCFKRICIL